MMTAKRVMFAVMCVLLIAVIVMTGIVIGRIGQLFQSVLGTEASEGTTTSPAGSSSSTTNPSTTTKPTEPSSTPTTQPTTVPTTLPTEPGHEHEFVIKESEAASCDRMGYNIYECTGCGKQDIRDMVDPFGHNYGAGQVVEPTCEEHGGTYYTCSRCGYTDERNRKEALGHEPEFVETVPATCEAPGYDLYRCLRYSDCSLEEQQNETPAIGHSYEPVGEPTAPTCTEDGHALQQCTVCGQEQDEVTPATGHVFGEWAAAADGSIFRTCDSCGYVETSAELKITNQQVSVSDNDSRMYIIYVGTDREPQIYHCIIYDHLNNGTLSYALDPVRGLVVTYINNSGETVEIVRYFFDTEPITIPTE